MLLVQLEYCRTKRQVTDKSKEMYINISQVYYLNIIPLLGDLQLDLENGGIRALNVYILNLLVLQKIVAVQYTDNLKLISLTYRKLYFWQVLEDSPLV